MWSTRLNVKNTRQRQTKLLSAAVDLQNSKKLVCFFFYYFAQNLKKGLEATGFVYRHKNCQVTQTAQNLFGLNVMKCIASYQCQLHLRLKQKRVKKNERL